MTLKNCKIGILVSDQIQRKVLHDWLWQQGAIVYCANDEEEIEQLAQLFAFDIAIVDIAPKPTVTFGLN